MDEDASASSECPVLPVRGNDRDPPRPDWLHGLRDSPFQANPRGHADLPGEEWLFSEVRDTRERDAYAAVLAREPWHWFCTLTFARDHQRASGGMHPEKADKAFRYFIRHLDEHLYGDQRETRGRSRRSIVWARGQEFHKDGKVHFHAVLAAPDRDLDACCSRYQWHEWWFKHFGRNQIEQPRSQDDVLSYVSKYVTKDGEVDFSHNFGKARPPRLFAVEPVSRPSFLDRSESATGRPGEPSTPPARRQWGRGGLSLTPPLPQMILIDRTKETETRNPTFTDLET